MDGKSFPRSIPLEGILRNDCRIQRCEPGEIVVREGDYGNSAFLVLAGNVKVVVDSLDPEQLGRTPTTRMSWDGVRYTVTFAAQSIPSHERLPKSRPTLAAPTQGRYAKSTIDQRSFLQDFDAILSDTNTVTLGPGELFGEVAAMYRSPRTATVVADTEATLLEVRWQGLRILRRDQKFADSLDQHYRSNWLTVPPS